MLTRQFLITLTVPLMFVLLAVIGLRSAEKPYRRAWTATLLVAALWGSSIVSYYLGTGTPAELGLAWRVVGRYALSAVGLLLFLTSARLLERPPSLSRAGCAVSAVLIGGSLALDTALGPWVNGSFQFAEREVTYFSLWATLWVATWIVPLVAAWLVVRKTAVKTARSLYRNRLDYWQLTLLLFLGGGTLALVQQPRQPAWQELGAVVLIGAALLGNMTLRREDLPYLKPTVRRLGARLASTILVFALTWGALWALARTLMEFGESMTSLELLIGAALFAGGFILVSRLVEQLVRRLLLPRRHYPRTQLGQEAELAPRLADPAQLANLVLRLVQVTLVTEQAHLLRAEAGPGGSLIVEGLASLQAGEPPRAVVLGGTSPLTTFLRRENTGVLSTHDLQQGSAFAGIPAAEREIIGSWNSRYLVPLQVGDGLAGVLVLSDKLTGAPYSDEELRWLQTLAAQTGPLLWQAQQIAILERLNCIVFDRVDRLSQEQQFLQELSKLYRQFTALVSPQLYAPFGKINRVLQQLETENAAGTALSQPLTELRTMLGHLVNVADRVQQQREFHFAPMLLNDVVQEAVRNLAPMAEARRVRIAVSNDARQPTIHGDEERLAEAVHHLLHNAIKFNRIGGSIVLESGMMGNELFLHIRDTGVGIPPERINEIWSTISQRQNGQYRGSSDGLGLLLTRFIVGAHGGHVEVSSRYGSGSTFSIFLPLALEA
ncbi:MAG: GAF domain-containing sensor histidine kinase [Anaerolineae bacterium]|nr:GAF domain-containing sensor histidine kinase [Anaerolineae bacterium]